MDEYPTKISKSSIHGRGLISQVFIPKKSIILSSEVLDVSGSIRGDLINHVFSISGKLILPVNKLAMINEDKLSPNCKVYYDQKSKLIILESLSDIEKDQELFIVYGPLEVV